MIIKKIGLLIFILIMFFVSISFAENNKAEYMPNEIIVKYKDGMSLLLNKGLEKYKLYKTEKVFLQSRVEKKKHGNDTVGKNKVNLNNIYRIVFDEEVDVEKICSDMMKLPEVIYAEPNRIGYCNAVYPNDPGFGNQWALNNTGQNINQTEGTPDADMDVPEAWEITTGSPDVVIAVVDTGIELDHSDLLNNIRHNPGETPDDGIDNDSNGYIDDVNGWDFVSVPESYTSSDEDPGPPDNDTSDKQGHGTFMAGVISASGDNGEGVSGMTWHCKLMPVRVGYKCTDGTARSNTTDMAAGIIYAADNGADVINFSWNILGGSITVENAINYAHEGGVIIVTGAGNLDVEQIFFPAGLDNVITVAGTDANDHRGIWAPSVPPLGGEGSNYGLAMDVAAPSCNIMTTFLNNSYGYVNGTSASAAFTSGLAGLILSQNPDFTNREVKEIIYSTADTVFSSPHEFIGRGRINAAKALELNSVPKAIIDNVTDNNIISGHFQITGTAQGDDYPLDSFIIELGVGLYPDSWTQIAGSSFPVTNGVLADFDTGTFANGRYRMRLTVNDTNGNYNIKEKIIFIDNDIHSGWPQITGKINSSDPVIGDLDNDGDMEIVFCGRENSWDYYLYIFKHDGSPLLKKYFSNDKIINSPVLADFDHDNNLEILVSSLDLGFHSDGGRVYMINADGSNVDGWPVTVDAKIHFHLSAADLDGDGDFEIVATAQRNETASESRVYIWNSDGTPFMENAWPKYIDLEMPPNTGTAQDYASAPVLVDFDNDGDIEIIVSFGVYQNAPIYAWNYDGTSLPGWPVQTDDGYTFHSVAGDIDNNGDIEIVGVKSGKVFVWNHDGTPYLPGSWPDEYAAFSRPVLADLDHDNNLEILFEGNNSKIYVLHHDGLYMTGWPLQVEDITGDGQWPSFVCGDVDGDGDQEIIAAGGGEKKIYIWHADGTLLDGWPKDYPENLYGTSPVIGDIDNDGKVELFISSYGLAAMWDFEGGYNKKNIQWPMHMQNAKHSGAFKKTETNDFDNDGDVDGSDLAAFAADFNADCLNEFAAVFGQ